MFGIGRHQNQGATATPATSPAASTAGAQVAGAAGQAAGAVAEAGSEKVSKFRRAMGVGGLLVATGVITGIGVPALIAHKTKKAAQDRFVAPVANAVGEWFMNGTTPNQRRMPAIGAKPSKQGYEFDV